jgi:hypothetical protein
MPVRPGEQRHRRRYGRERTHPPPSALPGTSNRGGTREATRFQRQDGTSSPNPGLAVGSSKIGQLRAVPGWGLFETPPAAAREGVGLRRHVREAECGRTGGPDGGEVVRPGYDPARPRMAVREGERRKARGHERRNAELARVLARSCMTSAPPRDPPADTDVNARAWCSDRAVPGGTPGQEPGGHLARRAGSEPGERHGIRLPRARAGRGYGPR